MIRVQGERGGDAVRGLLLACVTGVLLLRSAGCQDPAADEDTTALIAALEESTTQGFGSPLKTIICQGKQVDAIDAAHCGDCATACRSPEVCAPGADDAQPMCRCPMLPGYTTCRDQCVDLLSDTHNCGACGWSCRTGEVCLQGRCLRNNDRCGNDGCGENAVCCPDGYCLTAEQVATDRTNCGGCGIIISRTSKCINGHPVRSTARTCSMQCYADGVCCAVQEGPAICVSREQLLSDATNCGACGERCAEHEVCFEARCICPSRLGDASFSVIDGACTPQGD